MGVNLSRRRLVAMVPQHAVQGRRGRGQAGQDRSLRPAGREAAAVPAGSEGLFFLPYLSGERTPHADPDARGCFIGLTLAHGRGHLIRAIMEGVTYSMRDSLEIIEELGVPVRQIRASGGGSRSPLWRQIQADCLRPQSGHDQQRGRGGLRRGLVGRGGRRARSRTSRRPARPRSPWSRKRPSIGPPRSITTARFPYISSSTARSRTISSGSRHLRDNAGMPESVLRRHNNGTFGEIPAPLADSLDFSVFAVFFVQGPGRRGCE